MSDTRTIVVSIVGTGLATTTVIVAFTAIIASGINARFDDVNNRIDGVNRNVNDRIDDVDRSVNTRIDDVNRTVNARFDDVNARIDDLRTELIAGVDDLRTELTTRIEAVEGNLAGVRTDLRRFDDRLRAVEIAFGQVDQRLETLERLHLPAGDGAR